VSTFKVEIVKINGVMPHPNADRLDIVQVNDWQCVTAKGNFKVGDLAVYFPIDSLLPANVESAIFGPDAKVKLTNSRVRTIKLRGAISQGIAVRPETFYSSHGPWYLGQDVTNELGITKYEPEVKGPSTTLGKSSRNQSNPNFHKYGGIENAKNYPDLFQEGEEVVVTEKIHGTNFRAGYVPFYADTLFKRVKQFFGLTPKYEFVYGSNNVQLQSKLLYKGYYNTNVYAETVFNYGLQDLLEEGEVIYGEVYGDGVQKGYTYGCGKDERNLIVFDVMVNGKYLNILDAKNFCDARGLNFVPIIYMGTFNKEKILAMRDGDSILSPEQKIREGVVVKPVEEQMCYIGRKFLKYISDNYLLKNQDNETLPH
jgi:RNA ligase (TIGR02306 family)